MTKLINKLILILVLFFASIVLATEKPPKPPAPKPAKPQPQYVVVKSADGTQVKYIIIQKLKVKEEVK